MSALGWDTIGPSELQPNLIRDVVGNLDDMADTLPGLMELARITQTQLVAHRQAHFSALQFGQSKPRHSLLVKTQVPSHGNIGLGLTFLQPLIIVSFYLDQGTKYILVLIRVLIAWEDGLGLVVRARLFEVGQGGVGILAPKVLETVDLSEGDLTRTQLLRLAGRLDEPREEGAVINKWRPKRRVPGDVLAHGSTRLAAT